jgi:uncharacterized membrane protein YgcG
MSFSVSLLITEILSVTVMGFWATTLRKKNKAKFLELNLNNVKDLKEKDIDLYAINNMLRMDNNDPTLNEEGKIEMLKHLGVDLAAMQMEAMRVKKEQDDYDNDPSVSEQEREQRRQNRIEEREREEREREARESRSRDSSSSDASDSSSDSSSGDGGGFDGGGAGASW